MALVMGSFNRIIDCPQGQTPLRLFPETKGCRVAKVIGYFPSADEALVRIQPIPPTIEWG